MGRWPRASGERATVLAAAILADCLLGEPPAALHPVVWVGRLAGRWSRGASGARPLAEFAAGAALLAAAAGASAAGAAAAEALVARLPLLPRVVGASLLLKPTFAVRGLLAAADGVRSSGATSPPPATGCAAW